SRQQRAVSPAPGYGLARRFYLSPNDRCESEEKRNGKWPLVGKNFARQPGADASVWGSVCAWVSGPVDAWIGFPPVRPEDRGSDCSLSDASLADFDFLDPILRATFLACEAGRSSHSCATADDLRAEPGANRSSGQIPRQGRRL